MDLCAYPLAYAIWREYTSRTPPPALLVGSERKQPPVLADRRFVIVEGLDGVSPYFFAVKGSISRLKPSVAAIEAQEQIITQLS